MLVKGLGVLTCCIMGVVRNALKDIPNVLYTPYISGKSIQSVERLSQKTLANIRTFLSEAPQV